MELVQIKGQSMEAKVGKVRAISAKTGVHEAFVMLLVEISPIIEADVREKARLLGVGLDEVSQTELNWLMLAGIAERFKGRSRAQLESFAIYCDTGVTNTPRESLDDRQWLRECISEHVELVMGRNVGGLATVESQLRPIVKKLAKEALDAVSDTDLSAKDKIQLYEKLSKLQAQLSGELVERSKVELGATEAFMGIMKAAEGMSKDEVEGIRGSIEARFELIEAPCSGMECL